MYLSNKLIAEFQKTYREKFGEDISDGKARKDLSTLVSLVKIIIGGKEDKK